MILILLTVPFLISCRSKRWVINSRRQDLLNCSVQYLNSNVRFCSMHFEPHQFHPGTSCLKKDAAPTCFNIPNHPPAVSMKRPLTERQCLVPAAKRPGEIEGYLNKSPVSFVMFCGPLSVFYLRFELGGAVLGEGVGARAKFDIWCPLVTSILTSPENDLSKSLRHRRGLSHAVYRLSLSSIIF